MLSPIQSVDSSTNKNGKFNKVTITGSDLDSYTKTKIKFMTQGTGKSEKQVILSILEWAVSNEKILIASMQNKNR